MKYKVLSLNPPYGTLIQLLLKRFETRGRRIGHRGPLLIHQTINPGPDGEVGLWNLCLSDPFRAPLLAAGYGNPARLPRGQIIAVCELRECLLMVDRHAQREKTHESTAIISEQSDQERAFGDWRFGRYALPLADVRTLPVPIVARGMPGLWEWEGDLGL